MAAAGRDPDRALFADELRAMRKRAGLTRDDLGGRVGYSGALIGMVEAMHRAPTRDLARRLDEAFSLPGTFTRMEERLRGVPFAASFRPFQPYEAEARSLRTFEHSLIPGLLQTPDYARAVLATRPNSTPEEIDGLVAARLARQVVLDREDPSAPLLWVLLDEGVLNRPVASRDIMREQLLALAQLPRANVTVQVVPYGAGGHSGLLGAFVIADLDDSGSIVYMEDAAGGRVGEDAAVVAEVTLRFDTLRSEALPKGASRDLIVSVAKEKWT
jgi:transcriptional regulator with XRE-family HTH domain